MGAAGRLVGRAASTSLLFLPLVVLSITVGGPFMAPTLASTAAIALAAPHLFRASWSRILNVYVAAATIAVCVALPLHAAGVPDVVWAAMAGAAIAVSAPGRVHAPTACFPFALTGADSSGSLLLHGVAAMLGVVYLMLALRLSARREQPGNLGGGVDALRHVLPASKVRRHAVRRTVVDPTAVRDRAVPATSLGWSQGW